MDLRTASLEEMERRLRDLEAQAAQANPGILDVMLVYGNAEAAMRQATEYLALFDGSHQPLTSTNAIGV